MLAPPLTEEPPFVQLDRVPADAVLFQEFPEDARMLDRDVLENQEAHDSGIRNR